MKKKYKIICLALAIILIPVLLAVWLITKENKVTPEELDYLRAYKNQNKLILVGAWEAPGGAYLSSASHQYKDGKLIVKLYGKNTLHKSRIFNLTLPISQIPDAVYIDDGTENYFELPIVDKVLSKSAYPVIDVISKELK